MLERVFPSDVIVVEAAEASEATELHPEEAAQLGRVSEQRRHEFAAGRACARLALERLGLPAAAPLLSRPDRSPAWPEGAVGSISHCQGGCAAAVGLASRYAALGLDLEREGRTRPELARRICTPAERARLDHFEGLDALGLIFSSKEAVYKAWHPLTGIHLGFQDVEIDLEPENGRFHARLLSAAPPQARGHARLEGRFVVAGGLLAAGVALARG